MSSLDQLPPQPLITGVAGARPWPASPLLLAAGVSWLPAATGTARGLYRRSAQARRLHIAIPSALSHVFVGLFMALAVAFSMLFITHDLAVARWFADRVAVLYRGRLCEIAPTERLFAAPSHPHTASLLAALRPGDPGPPIAGERGRHPFHPPDPAAISMGKLP